MWSVDVEKGWGKWRGEPGGAWGEERDGGRLMERRGGLRCVEKRGGTGEERGRVV